MSEKAKLVSSRIKIIRVTKRMQQQELADRIGVSQAHMSNMESGRSSITLENLIKLHEVFDCPMKEFFVDIDGGNGEHITKTNMFSLDELTAALLLLHKKQ